MSQQIFSWSGLLAVKVGMSHSFWPLKLGFNLLVDLFGFVALMDVGMDLDLAVAVFSRSRGPLQQLRNPFITSTSMHETCVGNQSHDYVQGIETSRSAYYPRRMVKSIAQAWRKELFPEKRLSLLHAPLPQSLPSASLDLHAGELADGEELELASNREPTQKEREQWMTQLKKYHRASGHPNNFNLARILRDADLEKWTVNAASSLHCDECAALKLGGESSGKIPPASMRPMPKAWEVVGMGCTEWNPPGSKKKLKILVMMDLSTPFNETREY